MKVKRIVFTPLLENGKPVVRRPMGGDWIESDRSPYKVRFDNEFATNRPIYVRTEEEVELPDPPVVYEWVERAVEEWYTERTPYWATDAINRHAAEVSPERLFNLIIYSGMSEWSEVHDEAKRLLEKWRRR